MQADMQIVYKFCGISRFILSEDATAVNVASSVYVVGGGMLIS